MFDILIPWIKLALCTGLIGLAGPALVRNAERIAALTGLMRSWIGLVLLAMATSLPELFTGISATAFADTPNIAVGDILGSCVFNLLMLVFLDELSRSDPVYRRIDQGHILTAAFGVIMIGSVGAFILLNHTGLDIHFQHISIYSPILFILYLIAIRAAFDYEQRTKAKETDAKAPTGHSLAEAILRYCLSAALVAAAGLWLPFIGADIAKVMGWQTTFVGTLLIAASTSVPEMVVTISALRLGAVDMAIGGLLGSNLFDILILAIDDLFYTKAPLLSSVSNTHAVTAFAAVVMSGIFIIALLFKPDSRIQGTISWISLSLAVVYLFSAYASFLMGH